MARYVAWICLMADARWEWIRAATNTPEPKAKVQVDMLLKTDGSTHFLRKIGIPLGK